MYDNFYTSLDGEGVYPIHNAGLVGIKAALFSDEHPVDVNLSRAQQFRQVKGQFCRCVWVFQHQTIGRRAVWRAKVGGKIGIFSDVGVLRGFHTVGKVLRLQQLARVVFPAIHQEGCL